MKKFILVLGILIVFAGNIFAVVQNTPTDSNGAISSKNVDSDGDEQNITEDGQTKIIVSTNTPYNDGSTYAWKSITYPHHERHAGSNYDMTFDVDSTSLIIAFKVEDQSKEPHFTFKWKTEEAASIAFTKGSTWTTATGSTVTLKNSNDNFPDASIMQGDTSGVFVSNKIVMNPTGLSPGTTCYSESVWSTNQTTASSGEGVRFERILEPGETYSLAITAASGGIWLHIDWYEHTPKN